MTTIKKKKSPASENFYSLVYAIFTYKKKIINKTQLKSFKEIIIAWDYEAYGHRKNFSWAKPISVDRKNY